LNKGKAHGRQEDSYRSAKADHRPKEEKEIAKPKLKHGAGDRFDAEAFGYRTEIKAGGKQGLSEISDE